MSRLELRNIRWYRPVRGVVLLLALAGLSACASVEVGRPFDLQRFEVGVQRGVTTEETVRTWLGAPDGTGVGVDVDGTRYTKWTYYYGRGSMSSSEPPEIRYLEVQFDSTGKVRAYNWSR